MDTGAQSWADGVRFETFPRTDLLDYVVDGLTPLDHVLRGPLEYPQYRQS